MKAERSMRRSILRKAVKALLMFLLCFLLLSSCLTVAITRLAFGRRDEVPPTEQLYEEAETGPREAVSFVSGGRRLQGWLYGTRRDCRGLIVVIHGLGGGADSHLPEIRRFVSEGYAVLAYDGTGTRLSEGWGVRGLAQASADLEAALGYVQQDTALQKLPLLLYGHSAGAYAAALALPEHPEVLGAVCLAAFDRPEEEMLLHARRYAGILADVEEPFLRASLALLFGPEWNASAAQALSRCSTPVLIAAGAADEVVPLPVSLIGRADEISNPNASTLLCAGGHDDFWLSPEARLLRAQVLQGAARDPLGCAELDETVMQAILDFYTVALESASGAA